MQDPLGVVQPVHAEQQHLRLAQRVADLGGPGQDVLAPGQVAEAGRVDRDGKRRRPDVPHRHAWTGRVGRNLDVRAPGRQPRPPAARPQEVRRVLLPLEAEKVRAEQPGHDLPPPGQLREDFVAGERDVVEEPDPDVRALGPDHARHQLELVVVHPHGRVGGGLRRGRLGEPAVDRDVGLPPRPVELRRRDYVVVQRPEGCVAEALVERPDLVRGQADRDQPHAAGVERLRGLAGRALPADPGSAGFAHHGLERGHQAAGTGPPLHFAAGAGYAVYRQPAGHHDEAVPACFLTACEFRHGAHHQRSEASGPTYLSNHLRADCPLPARCGPPAAGPARAPPELREALGSWHGKARASKRSCSGVAPGEAHGAAGRGTAAYGDTR